jgi:catechol 2,3-dioxygenase-like lactoylglutathione lyase family enzyme
MIKPKAIDHIVLRTDRYQDLIDFYCNVLGCVLERGLHPKNLASPNLEQAVR